MAYLIPWPGPQVISLALTFFDPLTIEIQSSPSNKRNKWINNLFIKILKISQYISIHVYIYIYIPVLMTQLVSWIFCVSVMWIPSVLGLFPGAITRRFKALTFTHFWKVRCICCAFLNLRLATTILLHP